MEYYQEPIQPTQKQELQPLENIAIPFDAEPLPEVFTNSEGEQSDIVARIRAISGNNTQEDFAPPQASLLLVRNRKSGKFELAPVRSDDSAISPPMGIKAKAKSRITTMHSESGAPDVDIVVTAPDKKGNASMLHIAANGTDRRLRITTSPNVGVKSQPGKGFSEALNKNSSKDDKKLGRWITGLALASALAHGTNATEGFYDMAKDATTDADKTVEQMFPTHSPTEKAAVERVARTMQDLDDGNIDAINQRAEKFKQDNKDQLLSNEDAKKIEASIDAAKTNEEVAVVLNDFAQGYGKTVKIRVGVSNSPVANFDPATPPTLMKDYAKGIVDALGSVPKSYIAEADFKGFELGSRIDDAAGVYEHDTIALAVNSDPKRDSAEQKQLASIVTSHEIGHADDKLLTGYEVTGQSGEGPLREEIIRLGTLVLDGYLDRPEDVTVYAHDNGRGEKFAEAGAFSRAGGDSNKLAHPDQARLFESPANKKLLESAIAFDARFPGSIDYMTQRGNIAGKKSGLGRFIPGSPLKYWDGP